MPNPEPKSSPTAAGFDASTVNEAMLASRLKSWTPPAALATRRRAGHTIDGLRQDTEYGPDGHCGRSIDKPFVGSSILGEQAVRQLQEALTLLTSPALRAMIDRGEVTLALIKPNVHLGRDLPGDDEAAAQVIRGLIGEQNILFSMHYHFGPLAVDRFYGSVRERLEKLPAEDGVRTIWQTIQEFMTSGPLTILLLHRDSGDAVPWWRQMMGKTKPQDAEPESIRGKHGRQEIMPNNVVHGSDAIESVRQEVGFIVTSIERMLERNEVKRQAFPDESALRAFEVLAPGEEVSRMRCVFSRRAGESHVYGIKLLVTQPDGGTESRYLKEKNYISLSSGRAEAELAKFRHLGRVGAPVPIVYGATEMVLYGEFFPHVAREGFLAEQLGRDSQLDADQTELLRELCRIAEILDRHGYNSLGFTSDLLFDLDSRRLVLTDAGTDLGRSAAERVTGSLMHLLRTFYHHETLIRSFYDEFRRAADSSASGGSETSGAVPD